MVLQKAVVAVLVQDASHSVQVTISSETAPLPLPCLTVDTTHRGTILSPTQQSRKKKKGFSVTFDW